MCLVTYQKKPVVATEDIVCFKIVRHCCDLLTTDFYSYYYKFKWYIGKLYITELSFVTGLDYYSCNFYDAISDDFYNDKHRLSFLERLVEVSDGFHAMLDFNRANLENDNRILAECLIPKGSLIFTDATGLIVSNQMIMLGEVKIKIN